MYRLALFFVFVFTLFASDEIKKNESIPYNLLEKIRTTYYSGVENEDYIDSLKLIISKNFSDDQLSYPSIILAYSAGVEALKSKHAFWPFNKMSYLNSSMDLFQQAISKDPNNLEIRFMRYSILHYVPGILGYSEELEEDQKSILSLLKLNKSNNISEELRSGIISFLMETGRLSKAEINSLKTIQLSFNNE